MHIVRSPSLLQLPYSAILCLCHPISPVGGQTIFKLLFLRNGSVLVNTKGRHTRKLQGLIASCELAIFATKSSRRDLRLNSHEFKLVSIRGTSRRDESWSLRLDFEAKIASSHDVIGPCD